MDHEIKNVIEAELQTGEKLLWADKPQRFPIHFMFLMGTILGGLFSLIGIIFWLGTLITGTYGATVFLTVWTGMAMFFFWSYSKNLLGPSTQIFAITTKRAIIVERQGANRISSLNKSSFNQIQRTGNDDIGSLQFGNPPSVFQMGLNMQMPLTTFHKISNPREVENLIRKTFLSKD